MSFEIEPLGETFGAEIRDLDLSRPLSAAEAGALREAFFERRVLAVPKQALNPRQLLEVSRRFGPDLEAHVLNQFHHPETPLIVVLSNRVVDGRPIGLKDGGSFWHSDNSYKARPAAATVLYAIEVPDDGGDTLFCDMTTAYDELPAQIRARLDGLTATHDYGYRDEVAVREGRLAVLSEAQRKATPPVRHPVVRRHPVTGRKALYISPGITRAIDGLDEAESEALKQQLFEHCLKPRYCLRYRWRAGDVVAWDNPSLMHSATTKDLPAERPRTLWRTIVSGGPTA